MAEATPAAVAPVEVGDVGSLEQMKTKHFLDQLEHDRVAAAIRGAEKRSSGQVIVFITRRRPRDILAFARKAFRKLKLDRTERRNGVLIVVAPVAQKVAIFGDTAIDSKSDEAFWEQIIRNMQAKFQKGEFTSAIVEAVEEVGSVLAAHFPPDGAGRQNEISDDVVED